MYKRLNELNFVIGLFFTVVSLILLVDFFAKGSSGKLNLYTGVSFLVFGVFMITIKTNKSSD
jgi:hypothetical protein